MYDLDYPDFVFDSIYGYGASAEMRGKDYGRTNDIHVRIGNRRKQFLRVPPDPFELHFQGVSGVIGHSRKVFGGFV